MNDNQRLQLNQMISANNVQDQTDFIRELKHSSKIREELKVLEQIKEKYKDIPDNEQLIHFEAMVACNFLFMGYTDIYNRVRKDEINMSILEQLLNVLEEIEDGKLDQHEGSFKVGTILKELYIDSALKKSEKLDAKYKAENQSIQQEEEQPIQISWKQYKLKGTEVPF